MKRKSLIAASVRRMRAAQPMTRNMRMYIDAVAHLDDVSTDENRLKPDWSAREDNLMAVNTRRWAALTEAEQLALIAADKEQGNV
jgi:hypothetical protein